MPKSEMRALFSEINHRFEDFCSPHKTNKAKPQKQKLRSATPKPPADQGEPQVKVEEFSDKKVIVNEAFRMQEQFPSLPTVIGQPSSGNQSMIPNPSINMMIGQFQRTNQ